MNYVLMLLQQIRCYELCVDATAADNPVDTSNVVDTLNVPYHGGGRRK
jgi:hypothetical protein